MIDKTNTKSGSKQAMTKSKHNEQEKAESNAKVKAHSNNNLQKQIKKQK